MSDLPRIPPHQQLLFTVRYQRHSPPPPQEFVWTVNGDAIERTDQPPMMPGSPDSSHLALPFPHLTRRHSIMRASPSLVMRKKKRVSVKARRRRRRRPSRRNPMSIPSHPKYQNSIIHQTCQKLCSTFSFSGTANLGHPLDKLPSPRSLPVKQSSACSFARFPLRPTCRRSKRPSPKLSGLSARHSCDLHHFSMPAGTAYRW